MNKTLPDIFKGTRNVNTAQGANAGLFGRIREFTLVRVLIRNRDLRKLQEVKKRWS